MMIQRQWSKFTDFEAADLSAPLKLLKSLKHSWQHGTAQRMKLYHAVSALKLRI